MGVPRDQVPHNYGENFHFLRKMGVEIYGNRTIMMLVHKDRSDGGRLLSGSRSTGQAGGLVRVRRSSDCVLETPLTVEMSEG